MKRRTAVRVLGGLVFGTRDGDGYVAAATVALRTS